MPTYPPLSSGDYDLDQLRSNDDVCPYLDTLADEIYATPTFESENSSAFVDQLTDNLTSIFGGADQWSWDHVHDCMLSTVCTDRQLPDGDAQVPMTDAIFNATLAQTTFTKTYKYLYNDSVWSKLAQGNTAWHISSNLQQAFTSSASRASAYKFLLYSAHDTTVMPLLATLLGDSWDGRWSPYAAMMTLELYQPSSSSSVGTQGTLFRMVYDGAPVLLPGCNDTLCDATVLVDALAFGQENMPCPSTSTTASSGGSSSSKSGGDDDDGDDNCGTMNDGMWAVVMVISFVLGTLIGVLGMQYAIKYHSFSCIPGSGASGASGAAVAAAAEPQTTTNPLIA